MIRPGPGKKSIEDYARSGERILKNQNNTRERILEDYTRSNERI
jgi:hypothetical protein